MRMRVAWVVALGTDIKIIKSRDARHYCATSVVAAATHRHYVRFFAADTLRGRRFALINIRSEFRACRASTDHVRA